MLDQVLDAHGLFSADVHYRVPGPCCGFQQSQESLFLLASRCLGSLLSAASGLCLVLRWEGRGTGTGVHRGVLPLATSATEAPRGCAAASPVALAPCSPRWAAPRPGHWHLRSPRHRPRCRRGERRVSGARRTSPAEQSTSCTVCPSALQWLMLCAVHGS